MEETLVISEGLSAIALPALEEFYGGYISYESIDTQVATLNDFLRGITEQGADII